MDTSVPPYFEDLDDATVYNRCLEALVHADTRNLVIEFDASRAYAALDLENASVRNVLQSKRNTTRTRWINIWAPERQEETVRTIAEHYNFSMRLKGIMSSAPPPKAAPLAKVGPEGLRNRIKRRVHRKSVERQSSDLEKNEDLQYDAPHPAADLSHWQLVDEVWHYCSVDWGSKYLCIGYNSLSDRAVAQKRNSEVESDGSDTDEAPVPDMFTSEKPSALRAWTWLVLCHDGTVVCIYESHFDPSSELINTIKVVRRNILNVFKQLSVVSDEYRGLNPLNAINIRPRSSSTQGGSITIEDSAGLLFHYIFDDWYSSYSLVAKKEYQYSQQLDKLRERMYDNADPNHVKILHMTGRQLSVLKRVYESYALIIERIVDKHKDGVSSLAALSKRDDRPRQVARQQDDPASEVADKEGCESKDTSASHAMGPRLTAAAVVRFERLRDRINHFALSEIKECLDQKEQLVFLNFNLITMRQSQAVEKLTRITILLAKVTIVFMPVSLMTGYFSTQIQELQAVYTAKTYWWTFFVVMSLSLIFLIIFGRLSGTLEGGPVYRSLGQVIWTTLTTPWRISRMSRKHRKKRRSARS